MRHRWIERSIDENDVAEIITNADNYFKPGYRGWRPFQNIPGKQYIIYCKNCNYKILKFKNNNIKSCYTFYNIYNFNWN